MPARPAIATRWMSPLVDPPIAWSTTIALRTEALVMRSLGRGDPLTAISAAHLPLVSAMSHELAAVRSLQGGFLDRALIEAQTAVDLAPADANGQALLGDALMQLQRKDDAREAYQRALVLAKTVYPEFQGSMVPALEARLGTN